MQTESKPLKEFKVRVLVVQPVYMEQLGLAKTQYETRIICGHTLADAKRRAGIG